ncbi:MAG TPA: PRC-barrel domain-containing protein [Marmoricola sp.]
MTTSDTILTYVGSSGLEISSPDDAVAGLAVVDPQGLRIGEVEDVVIDTRDHRVRLICVVSGGILGFAADRTLLPVETVTKVDGRVHVDRSYAEIQALRAQDSVLGAAPDGAGGPAGPTFEQVYAAYGVVPFWERALAGD